MVREERTEEVVVEREVRREEGKTETRLAQQLEEVRKTYVSTPTCVGEERDPQTSVGDQFWRGD